MRKKQSMKIPIIKIFFLSLKYGLINRKNPDTPAVAFIIPSGDFSLVIYRPTSKINNGIRKKSNKYEYLMNDFQ
jgi:hypothetical protein